MPLPGLAAGPSCTALTMGSLERLEPKPSPAESLQMPGAVYVPKVGSASGLGKQGTR